MDRGRAGMGGRQGRAIAVGTVLTIVLAAGATLLGGYGQTPPPAVKAAEGDQSVVTRPAPLPEEPHALAGDCLSSASFVPLNCHERHDVEVTALTTLPDGAAEGDFDRATMPVCRHQLAQYLGAPGADATRLQPWAFWPTPEAYAAGQRWLLCGAAELDGTGAAQQRSGSVRGALGDGRFPEFQLCSAGQSAAEEKLRSVPCDQPHQGEAVPEVLALGSADQPRPSTETINEAGAEHCGPAVRDYLGDPATTVSVTWRIPGEQAWADGYTDLVCFAQTGLPITGSLLGHN
ncbi:hypothetical protein D5S17_00775 [Pseudonocardiaceae bacterium YIM PH 21723]|nr:hypothetical protein D5S17_00775 [Pseudonocardiaceae bacterium YIM PH 21723]